MKLFQSDKYQVFLGKGTNIAICSVWNEASEIFKNDKIKEKVAVIGTLYSRNGVNIMLRNLALNPQINKLYLWGAGKLSQTEFGKMGVEILKKVWQLQFDNEGIIKDTTFQLDEQLDLKVIRKIVSNVELIDVSDLDMKELIEVIKPIELSNELYMESVSFPDPVLADEKPFPSEETGFLMRGNSVIEVWLKVVERIMRYGVIKGTQYGYQQRELIGVNWIISDENPDDLNLSLAQSWPEDLRKLTGAIEKNIQQYSQIFLAPEKQKGIAYTYGNRLMQYPLLDKCFNQIEEVIIKQLQNSPNSRRAVATTLVPAVDSFSNEPPCITQVQALQTNGRLHFLVTVRSHDIFKAALSNAFGLRILQKKISDKLGFALGNLQINSHSAHIYEQDWHNAFQLVKCCFWHNSPKVFDEENDRDLRGYFIIKVSNKINVTFNNNDNEELMVFSATSADELIKQINHYDLISRIDHALDLGKELQKAEIALQKGVVYKQDRPLKL